MSQYLVMDIGGTFVKYALMDENGKILEQDKIPSVRDSQEAFFASLDPVFDQYRGKIEGCAVSMPGRIDTENGIAVTAGAFSRALQGCPVAQIIGEKLGVPVTIGNDGKCAAAAEAWDGALKDVPHGIVLVFGTGIGGGVVIDHKVHMGAHFSAGELSRFIFDGQMMADGYEERGKPLVLGTENPWWRSTCSARSLLRGYSMAKGLPADQVISGEEFFEAVRNGEELANEHLHKMAYNAAIVILSMMSLIDVNAIAIGGGISAAPELVPAIKDAVDELWGKQSELLPVIKPEIVRCVYGNDANLKGALKLFLDQRKGEKK